MIITSGKGGGPLVGAMPKSQRLTRIRAFVDRQLGLKKRRYKSCEGRQSKSIARRIMGLKLFTLLLRGLTEELSAIRKLRRKADIAASLARVEREYGPLWGLA